MWYCDSIKSYFYHNDTLILKTDKIFQFEYKDTKSMINKIVPMKTIIPKNLEKLITKDLLCPFCKKGIQHNFRYACKCKFKVKLASNSNPYFTFECFQFEIDNYKIYLYFACPIQSVIITNDPIKEIEFDYILDFDYDNHDILIETIKSIILFQ